MEYKGEQKRLKIGRSVLVEDGEQVSGTPGQLSQSASNEILISCKTGALRILDLQLEGKRMMSAEDFLKGIDLTQLKVTAAAAE